MFKNSSKILFLMILLISSMISISSNSWMGAWMGLEINLLSFIPLMKDKNNLMSSEASLKYFLTQVLASSILLFAIIMIMLEMNLMATMFNWMNIVILSSLMIKSGVAPFHYWFPNVMEGLSWTNGLILMTWQKVAPILLISYTMIDEFLFFCIIMSAVIGALGGLNQTSLRKLMAFSSINHLSWILTAMMLNESIWMIYFSIYVLINISLILLFNLFKTFHINQLFSMFMSSKTLKILFFLNMLSLGGLPPFLGFASKWLVIHHMIVNSQLFIVLLLVMSSLITLFFYLRLCYSSFLLNYHEQNWLINMNFNKNKMFVILIFTSISIFGLMIISLLYFML